MNKTFNLKRDTGLELPVIEAKEETATAELPEGMRSCPQCDGLGAEDSAKGTIACRKCHGEGLVRQASEERQMVKTAQSEEGDVEDILGDVENADISDAEIEDQPGGDLVLDLEGTPYDQAMPPREDATVEQLKQDIAVMLSGSFDDTIVPVFDHVASLKGLTERTQGEYNSSEMKDFLYEQLDDMSIEELRTVFEVIRKNEQPNVKRG